MDQIQDKHVSRVVGCIQYAGAVHSIAGHVKAAPVIDANLKPFNLGRHSKKHPEKSHVALEAMVKKATANNDWTIPIAGGDSWKSYFGRIWKTVVEDYVNHGQHDIAMLLDMKTIYTIKQMAVKHWIPEEVKAQECLLEPIPSEAFSKIYLLRVSPNGKSN